MEILRKFVMWYCWFINYPKNEQLRRNAERRKHIEDYKRLKAKLVKVTNETNRMLKEAGLARSDLGL